MCFGSFIGYSGSFPKLISDVFGYLTGNGCLETAGNFVAESNGATEAACAASGGEWKTDYDYPNPNAPNGAAVAWLGAAVGSLIRPVGGIWQTSMEEQKSPTLPSFGAPLLHLVRELFCRQSAGWTTPPLTQHTMDCSSSSSSISSSAVE